MSVRLPCRALAGLLALPVLTAVADPAPVDAASAPAAPFEETRYGLGYEVYLANRNLPAAWQLARKALAARPADPVWLKRFAQVSEWVGQPGEALPAWLRLARQTGDSAAWDAVGRLAPMLLDDEAQLAWLQYRLARRPDDSTLPDALAATTERLGRPEDGLKLLRGFEGPGRIAVLEAEARLAERSGNSAAAIAALDRLLKAGGPREGWLLRRAALYYRQGRVQEARAGLAAAETVMPPDAAGYWQTYAELSRLLEDRPAALRAYGVLRDHGHEREGDLWNHAALLQADDPLAAATLQALLFTRFNNPDGATNALSLWVSQRAWAPAESFLAALTPAQRATLESRPAFLEQRAGLAWARGRLADARRDYEHGLRLSPDSARLAQGLAGVLLEQGDAPTLRRLLERGDRLARARAPLWPTWAAGWQFLQQPARALPFLQARLARTPDDGLAALNLADTLEALGRTAEAETLRRDVLRRQAGWLAAAQGQAPALEDALLALRLRDTLPEPALRLLRQRMKTGGAPDRFSRELALGWLLNHDAPDAARALAAQWPATEPLPDWAALGFALADNDRPGMETLIAQRMASLPVYDRLEAAERLGRDSLAVDTAFRTLEEQRPDDDELQRRFVALAATAADRADLVGETTRQSGLTIRTTGLALDQRLRDDWRLSVAARQDQAAPSGTPVFAVTPDTRSLAAVGLNWRNVRHTWQAGLRDWQGAASGTGGWLAQDYRARSTLTLGWRIEQAAPAGDSLALRAAGRENRLETRALWQPDARTALGLQWTRHAYRGNDGSTLGDGDTVQLDGNYRPGVGPADSLIKLQLAQGRVHPDTTPLSPTLAALVPAGAPVDSRFFLPPDDRQIALAWAFGERGEEPPSRHWRLDGEAGVNRSDSGGTGYQWRLGLTGAVFGPDRLRLDLRSGRTGVNRGELARVLTLSYRLYY